MKALIKVLLRGVCACGDWYPPGKKCDVRDVTAPQT